ncbi:beta-galactosidase 13-like [Ricinus communis]|uniref:beta-galactosidase 13-like n=1 Tax=Ricinus communis TaxID=3988 RepID=UPI00201AC471|nr:beta-galactosidase 13-like [Ricinus communis]
MTLTRHDYLLVTALFSLLFSLAVADKDKSQTVSYDGRSLIVNGKRELLFSGSIHYPRSTPDMWPELIAKAKHGGLNVIQTYVFWNIHEPEQGKYNFEGRFDLVKFMKMIGEQGMYATLRLGPFIQAEWNHGGLPYWLREVPDIIFRSYNEQFMHHMEKFIKMIINKMKEEKLFAPQGGPIILAQIENEYNTVQLAYRDLGHKYVQWAGNMAVGLNVGVPWVMCKQKDAPDPVINTCNGRHCGDTFTGPNRPDKPSLWTENWTAQFRVFGDPPSQRAAEDSAFSVARWFSKNGSLVNYYMYHGGTNFDRTAASFVTTRYYDEAPLDEYGLQRQPKYGHLKDLHRALRLAKKALLWGTPGVQKLGEDQEARFYEQPGSKLCAAFLTNNDSRSGQTVEFRGREYHLPPRSISVLPDCKTVVYNTMTIVSQHNARNFEKSKKANKKLKWEMAPEVIPTQLKVTSKVPMELYGLTKDVTDYAWYTTVIVLSSRDLSLRKDIRPVLRVASLGHAMIAFVNGEFIGSAHGSQIEKSFVLQKPVTLKPGVNTITLLGSLVGLPDSGAYMEHRYAGPRGVTILGLNTGTLDLSSNGWGHEVGLTGERDKRYSEEGAQKVSWQDVPNGEGPPITWYKSYFDEPEGNNPVVVRMTGMKKGMVWINGQSIGRYWMSYLSPLGETTQAEYHIPRSYLKPKDNLIIVMEEEPANPDKIEILLVNRDTICSYITEYHPPNVKSWARKNNKFRPVVDDARPAAHLKCPNHKKIVSVEFASWGDPYGSCGSFALGNCTSSVSEQVVEQYCLGKAACDIPIERDLFDKNHDACPDIKKTLAVQVKCG